MKAAEIAENAIGHEHIWTAELYSYMALMHEEEGENELASPWIRKSFMSCYKAVGISHKATKSVFTHLRNIECNIGSTLANIPIELVVNKIKQGD